MEGWVSRGSPKVQGHWLQQSRKVPFGIAPLEVTINLTIQPVEPRVGSPLAQQLPKRKHNPTHQQII